MWRWIVAQIGRAQVWYIPALKKEWFQNNGYDPDQIMGLCFFCEASKKEIQTSEDLESTLLGTDCERCPAIFIDPDFDCALEEYNYFDKPKSFLAKLERMYKKWNKLDPKPVFVSIDQALED